MLDALLVCAALLVVLVASAAPALIAGAAWLPLSCRCPFLALSATVGNPEGFKNWLQKLKDTQLVADKASGIVITSSSTRPASYEVHLIQHTERHNELVSQIYVPNFTAQQQQLEAPAAGSASFEDDSEVDLQSMPTQVSDTSHRSLQSPVWTLNHGSSSSRQCVGNSRSNEQAVVQQLLDHFASNSNDSDGSIVAPPPHGLVKLHPASSLSLDKLSVAAAAGGGWPPELDMAPDEALQLYDALMEAVQQHHNDMAQKGSGAAAGHASVTVLDNNGNKQQQQHQGLTLCEELSQLCPESCLSDAIHPGALSRHNSGPPESSKAAGLAGSAIGQIFATKQSAKAWTRQLKNLTARWAQQDESSKEVVQQALHVLSAAPTAAIAAAGTSWRQQHPRQPAYDWEYQRQHLMQMILDLRRADQLPAILFNFERGLCMRYARVICGELAAAEVAWAEHNADKLQQEREKLEAAAAAGVGDGDDGGSRGANRKQQAAAGSSGGCDLRTVIMNGVVASVDEEVPHPSFTLLPFDKAKSTVRNCDNSKTLMWEHCLCWSLVSW